LFVRAQLVARNRSEHFFVGHAETHIAIFAILEAKHLVANRVPAARFLPNLRRMQRRQIKLLAANAIHFFTQDGHHL
jgi:hypothetical protein